MRRRIAIALVVLGMVTAAAVVAQISFSDVPEGHEQKEAIEFAVRNGWFLGYPDGSFRPDRAITSQQITTVMQRAFPEGATRADVATFMQAGYQALGGIYDTPDETTNWDAYNAWQEAGSAFKSLADGSKNRIGSSQSWCGGSFSSIGTAAAGEAAWSAAGRAWDITAELADERNKEAIRNAATAARGVAEARSGSVAEYREAAITAADAAADASWDISEAARDAERRTAWRAIRDEWNEVHVALRVCGRDGDEQDYKTAHNTSSDAALAVREQYPRT